MPGADDFRVVSRLKKDECNESGLFGSNRNRNRRPREPGNENRHEEEEPEEDQHERHCAHQVDITRAEEREHAALGHFAKREEGAEDNGADRGSGSELKGIGSPLKQEGGRAGNRREIHGVAPYLRMRPGMATAFSSVVIERLITREMMM